MTTETSRENRFVPRVLPWGLAAALLALYLVTLGRGITLNNLQPFAQVSGLQWQPVLTHPLYFLVTLPLKLLPSGWLPGLESTARKPVSTSRLPVGMKVVVNEKFGSV